MPIYIDPSLASGGKGTLSLPFALADGVAALNAIASNIQANMGGLPILFKSGTFGRLATPLFNNGVHSNFALGYYGTGAKPILSATAIKAGAWTNHSGGCWKTAHTTNDRWFYGGAASNGVVGNLQINNLLNNPYGTSLRPVASIAAVIASVGTSYNDATFQYVNIGVDPNTVVMEYTNLQRLIQLNTNGKIFMEAIRFAGSYDCQVFINFTEAAVALGSYTFKHLESDSSAAPRSTFENSAFQLFGPSGRLGFGLLQGAFIDDFLITNGYMDALDVMGVEGGFYRDIRIDNCGGGVTLWNNVNGCEFNRLKVTNIMGLNPAVGCAFQQISTQGGGNSTNNRVTSSVFANTRVSPVSLNGGSLHLDHCTIIGTKNQDTANVRSGAVDMSPYSATPCDLCDLTLTNCIIGVYQDAASQYHQHVHAIGSATTEAIHGDNNIYFTVSDDVMNGGSTVRFMGTYHNINYYNQTPPSFADWKAAVAPMDANSQLILFGDPGFVNLPPVNGNAPGYHGTPGTYMEPAALDVSLLPFQTLIAAADIYHLDTLPPAAAPILTAAAQGASTWTTGNWYFKWSYFTNNGETLPSVASLALALTSGTNKPAAVAPPAPPASALSYNVYACYNSATGLFVKQNPVPIAIGVAYASANAPVVPVNAGQTHYPQAVTAPVMAPAIVPPGNFNGRVFDSIGAPVGAV